MLFSSSTDILSVDAEAVILGVGAGFLTVPWETIFPYNWHTWCHHLLANCAFDTNVRRGWHTGCRRLLANCPLETIFVEAGLLVDGAGCSIASWKNCLQRQTF